MQGSQVMSLSVLNVGFSLPPSLSLPPLRGLRKRTSGVFRKRTEQTGASAWIQLDWEMAVQIALHYLTPVSVQWGWKPASANCWKRNCQYYDGNKSLILPFFWVLHVHRGEWAEGWISVVLSRYHNMGHVSVSFSCRHFKDTCLVTKSTWTPKMNLHFLPLMMYCCIPGRKKIKGRKISSTGTAKGTVLWWICVIFSAPTLFLHHYGVPGFINSSFTGPPSGWATFVHCEGKQQLSLEQILVPTKQRTQKGPAEQSQQEKDTRDFAAEAVAPQLPWNKTNRHYTRPLGCRESGQGFGGLNSSWGCESHTKCTTKGMWLW